MSGLDKETRGAHRVAREVDGAHREANPAQRGPSATVNLALPADPLNPGAEWAAIVRPIGGIVAMALPEAAHAYTGEHWERACAEFGAAVHAVALKRGWQIDAMPEVALGFAAFNLALPAIVAVAGRRKAAAEKVAQRAAVKTPPPTPPQPAEQPTQ